MTGLLNKSIYLSKKLRSGVLAFAVLCGAASPLFGQDLVAGRFSLPEKASFGKNVLPAGTYKFSVTPVGSAQAMESIQSAWQPVLVIMRPEKSSGPVASIFALARRSQPSSESNKLILARENDGPAMHALYLGQQGLLLDFEWASPKEPAQTLAEVRASGVAAATKGMD